MLPINVTKKGYKEFTPYLSMELSHRESIEGQNVFKECLETLKR